MKTKASEYSHTYDFRFVMDEAGPAFHCSVAAFSFMQAYRWALRKLRASKGKKARKFKLDQMDRY